MNSTAVITLILAVGDLARRNAEARGLESEELERYIALRREFRHELVDGIAPGGEVDEIIDNDPDGPGTPSPRVDPLSGVEVDEEGFPVFNTEESSPDFPEASGSGAETDESSSEPTSEDTEDTEESNYSPDPDEPPAVPALDSYHGANNPIVRGESDASDSQQG